MSTVIETILTADTGILDSAQDPDNDNYGNQYGFSSALSGDGSVLAVGARWWDAAGTPNGNQGAVYIYDRNGDGTWTLRGNVLTASDSDEDDEFGVSVALSDDGSVLAVGAWSWDGPQDIEQSSRPHGAVYIYDLDKDSDTRTQRGDVLTEVDLDPNHINFGFGVSVALSNDGSVLAVGSELRGSVGSNQGAVHIYDLDKDNDDRILRGNVLTPPYPDVNQFYGSGVALSGDGSILAVGSDGWDGVIDGQGLGKGAVYIYDKSGDGWNQRGSILTAGASAAQWDRFGIEVALSNDGSVLAVGATGKDGSEDNQGAVYIYDLDKDSDDRILRTPIKTASDAGDGDSYGRSIALSNDGSVLAIGSSSWSGPEPHPNSPYAGGADKQGAVYIYDESPTYSLSANLDSANEGSVVILTLQTTNIAENDVVPFTINGSGIVLEDFVNLDSLGAGEFTIGSDGSATFNLEINSDSTTEGPETFTVVLDNYQSVFVNVDINDTSTTPVITHTSHSTPLQKDATSKTYHLGWQGECATTSNFNLTSLSANDIHRVYQYNSDNKVPDFFFPEDPTFSNFTNLMVGKNYGIVLKSQSTGETSVDIPGFISTNSGTTGSLLLTDNCDGSPNSSHSTPLQKDATSKTYYLGWYGECSTESNFNLTSLSANDIHRVYQYNSDNKVPDFFFPEDPTFSNFTTLEKGKSYGIVLKSQSTGETSVDIAGFIYTNSGTTGSLLLTDNCSQTPSPSETYSLSIVDKSLQDSTTAYPHNENESLTFKLTTTGLNEGDPVAWEIIGSNITLDDFVGLSSLTGNFTLDANGESLLPIQLNEDSSTENSETFRLQLVNQTDVYIDVPIDDTSQTPVQLVLSTTNTEIDEGVYVNNIPFTELSLGTSDGTPLTPGDTHKIRLTGSGITPDDFEGWSYLSDENNVFPFDSSMEVDFVVDNNGYADSVMLSTRADSTTEGPETVRVILVDDPNVFVDIDINDTSQTPTSYSLHIIDASYGNLMGETGGGFPNQKVIELRGVGVPLNTVVPFTISGSNITLDDFIGLDSLGAGEFTLDTSGQGYNFGRVTLTTNDDEEYEGPEVFTLYLDEDQSVSVDISIDDDS